VNGWSLPIAARFEIAGIFQPERAAVKQNEALFLSFGRPDNSGEKAFGDPCSGDYDWFGTSAIPESLGYT
jgi:hypothetical protein